MGKLATESPLLCGSGSSDAETQEFSIIGESESIIPLESTFKTFPQTLGIIYSLPEAPPHPPSRFHRPPSPEPPGVRQSTQTCQTSEEFPTCAPASDSLPPCAPASDSLPTCAPRSPSILIPARGGQNQFQSTPQLSLSWDNYRESPSFSLSEGWSGLVSHIPLLSSWPGQSRTALFSETDPLVLDHSDTNSVEVLRADIEEEVHQIVATGPSELSLTPERIEAGEDSEQYFNEILAGDRTTVMDQAKVTALKNMMRKIEDELEDLNPAHITREEALQVEKDLTRIWDMKNLFRNLIRDLVHPLENEDPDRKSWEETCKQVVNKVISHNKQVSAQVETLLPTERMTEFQKMNIQMNKFRHLGIQV